MDKLKLKVGPASFAGVWWDDQARGWVFGWAADTRVANLFWSRLLVVGFSWPPIRWKTTFISTDS